MKRLLCALALLLSPVLLAAQSPVTVTVSGATVEAVIALPGGIEADLSLEFESVVGLSASSIGLSAELVNPLDPDLVARLADVDDVTIASAFPVLIEVEPPATGPLSFTDVVELELHTHNLSYSANSPLRLVKASLGGPFEDITSWSGSGSYRVGGNEGGFSQFLIVADLRPVADVIDLKFARLQDKLDANAADIDAEVLADLQSALDEAWSWRLSLDFVEAAATIANFIKVVESNSGSAIPNVWRSSRDLVNVAGELRGAAGTLRFSLNRASGP